MVHTDRHPQGCSLISEIHQGPNTVVIPTFLSGKPTAKHEGIHDEEPRQRHLAL